MTFNSEGRSPSARRAARRVLVCAAPGGGGAAFAARLAASGYEVQSVGADSAAREIENFAPQALVLEARGADGDDVADLARRLRAHRAASRLPFVVVFGDARGRSKEEAADVARSFARKLGADDCFSVSAPAPEVLARLDALFWRVGAGRDLAASRSADERRTEIEDFMRLIEDARAGIGGGASGALALVAAAVRVEGETANAATPGEDSSRSPSLQAPGDAEGGANGGAVAGIDGGALSGGDPLRVAHDFFNRNLRRADSLAFYGPDQLLAYLPRRDSEAAREDLARLLAEFSSAHPRARVAVGLARFPEDSTEIEELIERAEVSLEDARAAAPRDDARESAGVQEAATPDRDAREDGSDADHGALQIGSTLIVGDDAAGAGEDADGLGAAAAEVEEAEAVVRAAEREDDGARGGDASLEAEGARASQGRSAPPPGHGESRRGRDASRVKKPAREESAARRGSSAAPGRESPASKRAQRALRESQRGESFETSIMPPQGAAGAGGVLARGAADAAAHERALRSRGTRMPRRILLAVSDPARMAQVNLLLRSASYEVRAAFDGGQALDLLRIERADLLVLDLELNRFDGVEVLRRLRERNRNVLPLPVLLLHPRTQEGAHACAAARTLGARGFVALPYDPAELLEAVRETGGG